MARGTKASKAKEKTPFVVIPKMSPAATHSKRDGVSTSSSTGTSRHSSVPESPMEITPNSSVVNTPAPSIRATRLNASMSRLRETSVSSTGSKRKRTEPTRSSLRLDALAADEEIARDLQEQEYSKMDASSGAEADVSRFARMESDSADSDFDEVVDRKTGWNGKGKGKGKALAIADSEPGSELSDVPSDFSEKPLKKRTRLSNGKAKAVGKKPAQPEAFDTDSMTDSVDFSPGAESDDESQYSGAEAQASGGASDDAEEVGSDDDLPIAASRRKGLGTTSTAALPDSGSATPADSSMSAIRAAARNKSLMRARNRRRLRAALQEAQPWDRKQARRKKLEKAHPEIKTMWKDLENIPIIKPVEAEQPKTITRRLKGFQLEGLNWMTRQEASPHWKGGLLGDEMGMGKTIQAVSLIMSDFPAKDPTLVLVPPVALMQWANEINAYTNGSLKVLICHGTNKDSKNLDAKKIRSFNVIVMSYNSLESMYRKQVKGWTRGEVIVKESSPIHKINFHRLILDEAHSIKSRTTGVAKACFALKGTYKWCLSGTPVQNRIGEFFSLLRFLEVRPFADYFCEKCSCAQLHWSIDKDSYCTHCKHASSEHRSVFNEELLNPITGESMEIRSQALDKLHMITNRVMLRRLKKDYVSSMELPPKEIIIHNEFFGEIERDFSSSIMSQSSRQFDTYVSRGVMLNNYANIFGLIMQMRQVANHPDLILRKHSDPDQNVLVCNICTEPAEEAIRSRCRHDFCRACARTYIQSGANSGDDVECPKCHIPLVIDWEQPVIEQDEDQVKKTSIINRIKMENWTSSTKIEMLVYDLYKLRSRKQTLKSIVFSQFTSMLQLIEWRLHRAGFNTVMLDGSMSPVQRQRSIDYFMNNTHVEVFLVSLKAGGVALNLTEASRVFIVDPWWNPAAEWQSADRCHRIGQARPCVITRLVIEDSVESRMVMLQEKKARMIAGTVNNDKVAMEKLSPEDLQFLFRGS